MKPVDVTTRPGPVILQAGPGKTLRMVTMIQIDEWTGMYPSNWRGKIDPHALAHPAKYSSRLIDLTITVLR